MDLGLKDKVALVAASSQGLGRAVAEELAAEGASLVLCARDAHTLDQTAAAIAERSNTRVLAVPADVTNTDDIKRFVDSGIERFGRIDILVTNAGGPPAGRFDQLTHEQWEQAIRLTLLSAVELTRLVLPGMKERRGRGLPNIASTEVKQRVETLLLANGFRAGLRVCARTLANEVAADGI